MRVVLLIRKSRKNYIAYNRGDKPLIKSPILQGFSFIESGVGMKESKFQKSLIDELHVLFPGCIVLKNDPNYMQGIPDLSVFYQKKWAMLECKKSSTEEHQPNQDYYVEQANSMSFARFIYPENKEEVLSELQQAFRPRRKTRVSKRI